MKAGTCVRVVVGLLFMTAGFAKTKRFGKKLLPDVWKWLQDEFEDLDKALKDFPGRDSVKFGPAQWQELFGYIDLICGFLLLTENLVPLASLVLIIEMSGLEYALIRMKSPMLHQGAIFALIIALLSILCRREARESKDKSE